jgi:hypothetical protein
VRLEAEVDATGVATDIWIVTASGTVAASRSSAARTSGSQHPDHAAETVEKKD